MRNFLRKYWWLALIALLPLIVVVLCLSLFLYVPDNIDYETREPDQYGIYVGHAEEYMAEYIGRFFPERIEDYFQDVHYVFKSRAVDSYGFETMLEFTIEDDAQFQAFVADATEGLYSRSFHYDPSFQEYVVYDDDNGFVHDAIMLSEVECRDGHGKDKWDYDCYADPHPGQYYRIDSAKIAKILVNQQEHRLIYVAFAVHDGGGSSTDFFCEYFNRFGLDPKEYETYIDEIARFDRELVTKVAFVTASSDGAITEQEVLDPEQFDAFFQDFSDLKFYYNSKKPVGAVTGSAIELTFSDGTSYLFNHECTLRTINGQVIDTLEYYDTEVFADFWDRYCSLTYKGGMKQ